MIRLARALKPILRKRKRKGRNPRSRSTSATKTARSLVRIAELPGKEMSRT